MREDNNFLEYHPQLDYTKPHELQSPSTDDTTIVTAPDIDPDLGMLAGNTSAQIMQTLDEGLTQIQILLDRIAKMMDGDTAAGISFPTYLTARSEDTVTARAYEAEHQGSITGATAMDVLPALLDSKAELQGLQTIMQDRFYGGILPRNLDVLTKKEMGDAVALMDEKKKGNSVPIEAIRLDNTFRDVISDRVNSTNQLIANAAMALTWGLNEDTDGQILELIDGIATLPDLELLQQMNESSFDLEQEEFDTEQMRGDRLNDVEIRLSAVEALSGLQLKAVQVMPIIDQLADKETPALAPLIESMTIGIAATHAELKSLTLDLYRMGMLQSRQNDNLIKKTHGKRKKRQLHTLMANIARHYDKGSKNAAQRIRDMK